MNLLNTQNVPLQYYDWRTDDFFDYYDMKLAENEEKRKFWKGYIKTLTDIDFNLFSKNLKVPVLVPIGKRILFRGELKHTNEVIVSLSPNYLAKCSLEQAEVLRQHRIKDANSKLDIIEKERLYLENQISFRTNVFQSPGQEIIEVYSEEEYKEWRLKHRENVRNYYQRERKSELKEEKIKDSISDEDLWKRLEELELQEDLKNELSNTDNNENRGVFTIKNHTESIKTIKNHTESIETELSGTQSKDLSKEEKIKKPSPPIVNNDNNENKPIQMKDILDMQNELKKRIMQLQSKEESPIKTESDLISKLDKMGQVEEIEDEIHRLDDVIYMDVPVKEEIEKSTSTDIKRSVTFADEDESETLEIDFRHSDTRPCYDLYDPKKGILKPSDIYDAFAHLFTETTPILRKPKYEFNYVEPKNDELKTEMPNIDSKANNDTNKTIVVKDVNEKPTVNKKIQPTNSGRNRPMSIFKKRRQNRS